MLQTLGTVGADGIADGEKLAAVAVVTMQYRDGALYGVARMENANVEAIGIEADIVADTNGILPKQGLFAGDARSLKSQGDVFGGAGVRGCGGARDVFGGVFFKGAVLEGGAFVEVATLALGVENERHVDSVARSDGLVFVEEDGRAMAGGIALHETDSLRPSVAETEGVAIRAVSLVDGACLSDSHPHDNEGINEGKHRRMLVDAHLATFLDVDALLVPT